MPHGLPAAPTRRPAALIAFVILCGAVSSVVASDAQIVGLVGRGEARETVDAAWRAATVRQKLDAGTFVRTLDSSQMSLLLRDETQLRLNQNSMLQIKAIGDKDAPTRLELKSGRTWMQYRSTKAQAKVERALALVVETPNATAGIRGTDWELAIEGDGSTLLTVFSGDADLFNELGSITIGPGEQGRAEPGRAPVKLLITATRDRIQWVTAYRPQPARWARERSPGLRQVAEAIEAGRYAEAIARLERDPLESAETALMLADLTIAQGRLDEAMDLLTRGRERYPDDGRFPALLARAQLIAGRAEDARRLLDSARGAYEREIEIWLAEGDLARYEGNASEAVAAYRRALELASEDPFAWFGLGVVASEREHVRQARDALGKALRYDPHGPGFRGELGTLETFADNFVDAEAAFAAASSDAPDDYVALTGLGLMQLKRGDTQEALQSFLKAGVIEPRYARAALYAGVAYYQLGRRADADFMFRRAAELDRRDPLPYVLISMAATDVLDLGEAVRAAQEAQRRMPYLKSLNQILNDRRGSANVGSALASFGLEEWGRSYAYEAYNPYWAGSHLFLADRYNGTFNKNSELFQGYLTDPTVFGASNRFSSMLPRPGNYLTLSAGAARQSLKATTAQAIVNGYHNAVIPIAYFADFIGADIRPDEDRSSGDIRSGTIGLGARPRHDIGLFLFATQEKLDANLVEEAAGFTGNPQSARSLRGDFGVNFKFAPDSQAWFKFGSGNLDRTIGGTVIDLVGSGSFNAGLCNFDYLTCFDTTGAFDYRAEEQGHELQWRHTFDANEIVQVSWGIEYARREVPLAFTQQLPAVFFDPFGPPLFFTFYYGLDEQTVYETHEAYVSTRSRPNDSLLIQADLSRVRLKKSFERDDFFGQVPFPPLSSVVTRIDTEIDELNPRLGLAWRAGNGRTLRLAWQKWRRPAGQATLGMVDTAGIPLDDRLVAVGGKLQRLRGQFDWELDPKTFVTLSADRRKIDNLPNPGGVLVSGTSLENLERLRNLFVVGQRPTDFYEAEPQFAAGRVSSVDIAVNRVLDDRIAASAGYTYQSSENTGDQNEGNAIPLIARHVVQLVGTWIPVTQTRLSAVGFYRSARFVDEANTAELAAGWNLSFNGSWDSPNKRYGVTFFAENILPKREAGLQPEPFLGARIAFRL
jgi:Flp pilus assembly protein TadD